MPSISPRAIFRRWWTTATHSLGQTEYDVLIDFIDGLVSDGIITSKDLEKYLNDFYSDEE